MQEKPLAIKPTIGVEIDGQHRGEADPSLVFAYTNFLFDKDQNKLQTFLLEWLPNRTISDGEAFLLEKLAAGDATLDGRRLRQSDKQLWERISTMMEWAQMQGHPIRKNAACRTVAKELLSPDADKDAIEKEAMSIKSTVNRYFREVVKKEQ